MRQAHFPPALFVSLATFLTMAADGGDAQPVEIPSMLTVQAPDGTVIKLVDAEGVASWVAGPGTGPSGDGDVGEPGTVAVPLTMPDVPAIPGGRGHREGGAVQQSSTPSAAGAIRSTFIG